MSYRSGSRYAVLQPSLCQGSVLNHDVFLQNPSDKLLITPVRSVDLQVGQHYSYGWPPAQSRGFYPVLEL